MLNGFGTPENIFSISKTQSWGVLEENDIIGHGTTGLTSWQGALFLTDWLLANKLHKMKVRAT